MTIQEYTQAIKSSSIAGEIKAQIIAMLEPATEIDEDMEDAIALLIQKDIEKSLEVEADEETKKEFAKVESQFDKDVTGVEKQLETDLAALETEYTKLDGHAAELNVALEEAQLAAVKADLAQQG